MKPAIAGLTALLVVGCSGASKLQDDPVARAQADASAQMMRGIAECQKRYPARIKGKAAESIRCTSDAKRGYASLVGNGDLIRLSSAKSIEAAERYDAGKITGSQLDVELASIEAEYTSGTQSRASQASIAYSAQQQAAAAEMQAIAARRQESLARAQAINDAFNPKQTTTNCTAFGNTMNCTSR